MHWIIYAELKKFVDAKFGTEAWDNLLTAAELGKKSFLPGSSYPDVEAVAVVVAASKTTGKAVSELLEAFGEFIVPDLAKFYGNLIKPGWRTLDVIENTETMIHTIIRVNDPNARPPEIKVRRLEPRAVEI